MLIGVSHCAGLKPPLFSAGNTLRATQQPASCCPIPIGFVWGCICITLPEWLGRGKRSPIQTSEGTKGTRLSDCTGGRCLYALRRDSAFLWVENLSILLITVCWAERWEAETSRGVCLLVRLTGGEVAPLHPGLEMGRSEGRQPFGIAVMLKMEHGFLLIAERWVSEPSCVVRSAFRCEYQRSLSSTSRGRFLTSERNFLFCIRRLHSTRGSSKETAAAQFFGVFFFGVVSSVVLHFLRITSTCTFCACGASC